MSIVTLTKWGNSIGIRIPASTLKEAHLVSGQELEIKTNENGELILIPIKNQQEGWTDLFNSIATAQGDEPTLDISNEFDEEDWTW